MADFLYDRNMTKPRYTSTNLTPDAYAVVRRLTLEQSIAVGKRITMSDVVIALGALESAHSAEFSKLIKKSKETPDDQH